MRNKERIVPIMKFFKKNNDVLAKFLGIISIEDIKYLLEIWKDIEDEWLINPDYRFGQLLINEGIIQDGRNWFEEEVDWLIENGYFKFEELHWWGVNFYKSGRKRPKTKYVTLDKLEIDHIRNIIRHSIDNNYQINSHYLEYFNKKINGKDKQT